MAYIVLSADRIKSLKRIIADVLPGIRSAHCSEAIASAYGYRTYASLLECGRVGIWLPPKHFSVERFASRLKKMSAMPPRKGALDDLHARIEEALWPGSRSEPGMVRPGTVVKINSDGFWSVNRGSSALAVEVDLAEDSDGFTQIYTDKGISVCGREEIMLPLRPLRPYLPLRLWIPYGEWTEDDGSKVLFSRDYKPLWKVSPKGAVLRDKPWRHVRYVDREMFFDDWDDVWSDRSLQRKLAKRLKSLGVVGLPTLAQSVEDLVRDPDVDAHDTALRLRPDDDEDEVCHAYRG